MRGIFPLIPSDLALLSVSSRYIYQSLCTLYITAFLSFASNVTKSPRI